MMGPYATTIEFENHILLTFQDFIRAGITSPASQHIILTGSYDHTVRLWDTRTATSVLTVDHGTPVESLVCFPSGGVFVSAGDVFEGFYFQ